MERKDRAEKKAKKSTVKIQDSKEAEYLVYLAILECHFACMTRTVFGDLGRPIF